MTLLLDHLFNAVALGHFGVDLLNGTRAVLLAYLSKSLGLSNATLAFFSSTYIIVGSLTQPVFGIIADHLGPRWVTALGMLWMAVLYSLALMLPGDLALWLLVLASLGSASFHPAGTMQATLVGRNLAHSRETTAAAFFFFYGQAGLFLGPVLAGPILDRMGLPGLLILVVAVFPIGLNAAFQLRQPWVKPSTIRKNPGTKAFHFAQDGWQPFIAFALLAAFQAWTQQNMITFLPKYLADLGQSASTYGLIAALFMGGSAIGNTLGGTLADRFGRRRVMVTTLALASLPLYLTSLVGGSNWLYFLVPVAGALTGSVHSIIVVLAQRLIPAGMGLASGLILGFMFSCGAIGTLLSGFLADRWGFPPVFVMTAGIALGAAGLAMLMHSNEHSR